MPKLNTDTERPKEKKSSALKGKIAGYFATFVIGALVFEYSLTRTDEPKPDLVIEQNIVQSQPTSDEVHIKSAELEIQNLNRKFLGFAVDKEARLIYTVVIDGQNEGELTNCTINYRYLEGQKAVSFGRLSRLELSSSERGLEGTQNYDLGKIGEQKNRFFTIRDYLIDIPDFLTRQVELQLVCKDIVTDWYRLPPNQIRPSNY